MIPTVLPRLELRRLFGDIDARQASREYRRLTREIFGDLPPFARGALLRAGYRTREQVALARDTDLMKLRGLGRDTLRAIRAAIPHDASGETPRPEC